jgi:hypothetical protein
MSSIIASFHIILGACSKQGRDGAIISKVGFATGYALSLGNALGCNMFANPVGDTIATIIAQCISSTLKEIIGRTFLLTVR